MGVDLSANRHLLVDHERRLARTVAGEVVDKPILAAWMILIPIFFVFYYFQLKRYKNSLRDFSQNFLITRQRTADKVYEAAVSGSEVDIDSLVEVSDTPPEVKPDYRVWVETLSEHYRKLINREGIDYDELVRSAYPKKSSYLAVLGSLNRVESDFNSALAAHLPGDTERIAEVVAAIQKSVERNRREMAAEIYS